MKRQRQKSTEGKDIELEETEHDTDHRAESAGQSRGWSLASSPSHRTTTDVSPTRQNKLTASVSVSLSSASGQEQLLELEHKRKSSRLSSMRHQTRKRIEMEHLMELQANLRSINARLRHENQSLRNLVQQFREVVSIKAAQEVSTNNPRSAQANPAAHQPSNTAGLSNADPKPFINNVMSLFEVLNDQPNSHFI